MRVSGWEGRGWSIQRGGEKESIDSGNRQSPALHHRAVRARIRPPADSNHVGYDARRGACRGQQNSVQPRRREQGDGRGRNPLPFQLRWHALRSAPTYAPCPPVPLL